MVKQRLKVMLLSLLLVGAFSISGCNSTSSEDMSAQTETNQTQEKTSDSVETPSEEAEDNTTAIDLSSIPDYSGSPYIELNGNVPEFSAEELTTKSFENYGNLDSLGRCTVCTACIGKDLMPTEDREGIGSVKPTGWHTVKYNGVVDGNYLYNRCHLIGYQLSGENANEQNLITGTRYLNVEGMLPFENMVADYITETGNHVLYRVTPVYEGENLVASGVVMEAQSVEDQGEGIQFHVYCYNVQPGVVINYADGSSHLENGSVDQEVEDSTVSTETAVQKESSESKAEAGAYAVNPNNGKIHITGQCSATGNGNNAMSNPQYFATYEEAEAYSRQTAPDLEQRQCGNCW